MSLERPGQLLLTHPLRLQIPLESYCLSNHVLDQAFAAYRTRHLAEEQVGQTVTCEEHYLKQPPHIHGPAAHWGLFPTPLRRKDCLQNQRLKTRLTID